MKSNQGVVLTLNKKDIAAIRKQLKLDNDLLKINDIYNVYIKMESNEIFHEESQLFTMLDREQQELFLTNFKKVLGGKTDVKLFKVRFTEEGSEQADHSKQLLYEGLNSKEADEWKTKMQRLAQKMVQDEQYEKDVVVTFIRADYFKPTKARHDDAGLEIRDEVYTTPLILCSVNQTERPKRSLVFNFREKEFKSSLLLDPVINLVSPLGGFLFPCFTDDGADINHVLYAAGKANKPDINFIENVLDGQEIMTAEDDKAVFEEIIKEVVGDKVNAQTLANVYNEIHRMMEEDLEDDEEESVPVLDRKELERVLQVSGVADVDTEKVERAFQHVIDDEKYEMKASHVVPKYTSKSIKISTKVADIAISPADLRYVKQVNYNGKRCILIEVEEDTMIEGFKLIPEELLNE